VNDYNQSGSPFNPRKSINLESNDCKRIEYEPTPNNLKTLLIITILHKFISRLKWSSSIDNIINLKPNDMKLINDLGSDMDCNDRWKLSLLWLIMNRIEWVL